MELRTHSFHTKFEFVSDLTNSSMINKRSFLLLLSVMTCLLFQSCYPWVFPAIPRGRNSIHHISCSLSKKQNTHLTNITLSDELSDIEKEYKREALEILDCLTCPKDESDPAYDVEKDYRRDELLINTDYTELKMELKRRGLRTSGDKLEMMIRVMLHVIDPSVRFAQMTGREVNLQYVGKDDLDSGKVKLVSEDLRAQEDLGPDAEDLAPLRKSYITSPSNTVAGMNTKILKPEKPKLVMDGLTRKELAIPSVYVKCNYSSTPKSTRAYIVGGRDVLRTWEKVAPVVVVVPDDLGWRNTENRLFADEIAFYNQAIVIVPDVTPETPFNFDEAFDSVIAAFLYAQVEYGSKAISVAGIGSGGGLALTVAADLGRCCSSERRALWDRLYEESYVRRSLVIGAEDEAGLPPEDKPLDDQPTSDEEETDEATEQLLRELQDLQGNTAAPAEDALAPPSPPRYIRKDRVFPILKPPEPLSLGFNATLSTDALADLLPRAIFAVNPSSFSVSDVGMNLISPLYAVYGEQCRSPGCRYSMHLQLLRNAITLYTV